MGFAWRRLCDLGVRIPPRTSMISADLPTKPAAKRQEDVTISVGHHLKSFDELWSVLSHFCPSPPPFSALQLHRYLTKMTRWLVELHRTALPKCAAALPHVGARHLDNTFVLNTLTSSSVSPSVNQSRHCVFRVSCYPSYYRASECSWISAVSERQPLPRASRSTDYGRRRLS